ncbi:hypothetical protein [Aquipuribacter sp. SD81]|uniref:hypothetical protein n=1 Tax=Aquipuribacter sp. SD81 TaxID=3127703 RepID=UPI00301AED42
MRNALDPRPRPTTAALAAASLVLGFAVAEATGVRAAGGVVLLVGGGLAAVRWWRRSGPVTAVGLTAVYLGAFAGSHVLARGVGAWPAVATAAAVAGGAAYVASDRRPPRPGAVAAVRTDRVGTR